LDAERLVVGIDGRELAGRPTGVGRYLRNLLRCWSDGPDTLLVYFNGPAPAEPLLGRRSLRVRALGEGRERGILWQERRLAPAARADGVDVLFSPAYSCPLSLDRPRVTTLHDLSFFAQAQDFAYLDGLRRRLLVAASLRVTRIVLVQSDFTRRELLRLFPDVGDRARLVPLGPDDDLPPAPLRRVARSRLAADAEYLLTVGSILNRRCLPVLLRAAAHLSRRHPRLLLDVTGENRTQPPLDFDALVLELGLEHRVRFSGFVAEAGLADRYAAADVAVFLSEYEGFGLPALEAAARGVPLVVSREPAPGEIFAEAALLVDPHDETAVAAAIDRVLRDTPLRERLISAGYALARRFSWTDTASQTRAALVEAARP